MRKVLFACMLGIACGEGADQEDKVGISISTNLVPVVGKIEVTVEGMDVSDVIEGGPKVTVCGRATDLHLEVPKGKRALVARAEAGWTWRLEADVQECFEQVLDLGNTWSPFIAIMSTRPEELPMDLYIDDKLAGRIRETTPAEAIDEIMSSEGGEAGIAKMKRILGELAILGQAAVLTAEEGVRNLRAVGPAGIVNEEEVRFDRRLIQFTKW